MPLGHCKFTRGKIFTLVISFFGTLCVQLMKFKKFTDMLLNLILPLIRITCFLGCVGPFLSFDR